MFRSLITFVFVSGGYYIIERKTKLQIIVLNTNLMKRDRDDGEAQVQWDWLEVALQKFQFNGKTVSLFYSHIFVS